MSGGKLVTSTSAWCPQPSFEQRATTRPVPAGGSMDARRGGSISRPSWSYARRGFRRDCGTPLRRRAGSADGSMSLAPQPPEDGVRWRQPTTIASMTATISASDPNRAASRASRYRPARPHASQAIRTSTEGKEESRWAIERHKNEIGTDVESQPVEAVAR